MKPSSDKNIKCGPKNSLQTKELENGPNNMLNNIYLNGKLRTETGKYRYVTKLSLQTYRITLTTNALTWLLYQ